MRQLLITADDYGLHPDIDKAIEFCVKHKRVNSISIVPSENLNRDFLLNAQKSGIKLGLHSLLVDEPWLTKSRVWSRKKLFLQSFRSSVRSEIKAELFFQIHFLQDLGIKIDHIDSHQHVHSFPLLFPLFKDLKVHFGIARIRTPLAPSILLIRPTLEGLVLQIIAWLQFDKNTDYSCIGMNKSGRNTLDSIVKELEMSKHKSRVEMVMHPAFPSKSLENKYGLWNYNWKLESDLLLSEGFGLMINDWNNNL